MARYFDEENEISYEKCNLDWKNKGKLETNFGNVKQNAKSVKFGVKGARSPIFGLVIETDIYGDMTLKLTRRVKKKVGTVDITVEEWDFYIDGSLDDSFNEYVREEIINDQEFLKKLKELNVYEIDDTEEIPECEKEKSFDSILMLSAMDKKYDDLIHDIGRAFNSYYREGKKLYSITTYLSTEKDVLEQILKDVSVKMYRRIEPNFNEKYGFDFYEYRHQIFNKFFKRQLAQDKINVIFISSELV